MVFLDSVELEVYDNDKAESNNSASSRKPIDHYGDNAVDITDEVIEYPKGKVFDCVCGHGIGVPMEKVGTKCYSCGEHVLVDNKALERPLDSKETRKARVGEDSTEEESNEGGQTGLGDWT